MTKEYSPKQISILNEFDKIVKANGNNYPTLTELNKSLNYNIIRYHFGNYSTLKDEYELSKIQNNDVNEEENNEELKQVYKLKTLLNQSRKENNLLLKQITSQENIYDYICEHMPTIEYKQVSKITCFVEDGIKQGTAILHLSDLHYGEVVQFGNVTYDCAIAENRLSSIISQFCKIVKHYEKVVIFVNGDMLNGSIHDEFKNTNELVIIDSVLRLSKLLSESFLLIKEYMPEDSSLNIVFTVGNHSRTIPGGIYYKNKVKENWEYLLGEIIKRELNQSDIDVEVSNTPSIIYNVENLRFAVTHGDCFKSINHLRLGSAKFQEMNMSTLGKFDHLLLGHFHSTQIMNGLGGKIFVNGSFKESDEYSIGNLYQIVPPEQTVLIVNDDNIDNIIILNAND